MRLTMNTHLKVVLSALGLAAMLASPALAQTQRYHRAPVVTQSYGAGETYTVTPGQTPMSNGHWTAGNNLNPDFQLGGGF